MVYPADRDGTELCRVVLVSQFCCTQKKPQDLWIGGRCPAGDHVKQQEYQKPTEQAAEQVECRGPQAQGEEKEFSLRAENGERAGERTVNDIDASCIRHGSPQKR